MGFKLFMTSVVHRYRPKVYLKRHRYILDRSRVGFDRNLSFILTTLNIRRVNS